MMAGGVTEGLHTSLKDLRDLMEVLKPSTIDTNKSSKEKRLYPCMNLYLSFLRLLSIFLLNRTQLHESFPTLRMSKFQITRRKLLRNKSKEISTSNTEINFTFRNYLNQLMHLHCKMSKNLSILVRILLIILRKTS